MQAHEDFVRRFLGIVLACMALLALINLIVDPYEIFNTHVLALPAEPAPYFNKIEHLERNPRKHNGYLVGSSAIGFTPIAVFEHYNPGGHFYNLWMASATQFENLAHIRYLIKSQGPLDVIYLQIDPTLGMTAYRHAATEYARKLHPAVSGEDRMLFFFDYLTVVPVQRAYEKIMVNLTGKRTANVTDFADTGGLRAVQQEIAIAHDHEAYIRGVRGFHAKNERIVRGRQIGKNIEAIRQIVELCRISGVRLYAFVNPEHARDLDRLVLDDYLEFLEHLTRVTDYWDFSGYNSVTTNDYLYYQPGYFRPEVSRLIAARIHGDTTVPVPADFGEWITVASFPAHVSRLRREFAQRDGITKAPQN